MTAPALSIQEFTAGREETRLDRFLSLQKTGLSRSRLHTLIDQGMVTRNGQPARPAQKVKAGDRIILTIPPAREANLSPQDLPLSVLYQDAALMVIDKPAGLSVHPGPGHPDGTLVNALLARCPDLPGIGGVLRPGIVHRLDKDTSGLMVVAKTEAAHRDLSAQIKARQVDKGYLALVVGIMEPPQGIIDAPIGRDPRHRQRMAVVSGGRAARTGYRTKQRGPAHTLLELQLETGRTHQIRVHLAYRGCPILGDRIYGKASPLLSRHFLHAHRLGFRHPDTGESMQFQGELPPELAAVLPELGLTNPHPALDAAAFR